MKVKVCSNSIVVLLLAVVVSFTTFGQNSVMTSGEILYERRTNLEKRYEGMEQNRWMRGDLKKPMIEEFKLFFTDSTALFKPILPEVPDEREWATMKNTSYQNLNDSTLEQEFSFWGTKVYMKDTVKERNWVITGNKREIAGYKCRQAMWEANDSTKIYAWYADELIASFGPETFNGLPGIMLGLAIEDGGVVYFAKEVKPLNTNIEKEKPKGKAKDYYNEQELRTLVKERFTDWGLVDRIMFDMFVW
jgi:GLPGLI family protein